MILLAPKRARVPATLALLVTGVVARAVLARADASTEIDEAMYRMTPTHADGLLLGAIVAFMTESPEGSSDARVTRAVTHVGALGVSAALVVVPTLLSGTRGDGWSAVARASEGLAVGHLFACVIAYTVKGKLSASSIARLENRGLRSVGKVSYGMYLFHWALMAPALRHLDRVRSSLALGILVVVGGAVAVYALARVSYRFFESPFLRLKDRLHP